LNLIPSLSQSEEVALSVSGSEGVFLVPAFSGLYAPYWRSDARGVIVGLTAYHNKAHIVRAALEATAYQVNDVLEAMKFDSKIKLLSMKVDGGQTKNSLLMQFQADIIHVPLTCPLISETTALGACFAAGLAVQLWQSVDDLRRLYRTNRVWKPAMKHAERSRRKQLWNKALNRTLEWVDTTSPDEEDQMNEQEDSQSIAGEDYNSELKLQQGQVALDRQVSSALEGESADDLDDNSRSHQLSKDGAPSYRQHHHHHRDDSSASAGESSFRSYLLVFGLGLGIGIALHQLLPYDQLFRFQSPSSIILEQVAPRKH
jgi:hypothetical protein